ncbi:hypothetical protein NL108_013486 [Boleophthalmus pectinirostris]|uniref:C-factor-like n=1 Tax=Boleophthalmus pectinirostris TaxID=150288 RepID=UPI000A1C6238|nr:C-factor-like [Boleophthalmus pectinirostris]KAJ0065573.1 hypothetical protein NL108_013486 [Boleophthalmus pectinirostris]
MAAYSVLITGANRGIGLELVRQITETQRPLSKVFACCRDPDGPKAQELRALAEKHPDIIMVIRMDVADPKSIQQAALQVGSVVGKSGVNVVINNAAVAFYGPLCESTAEQMAISYSTNVVGPMVVMQEFLPYLRAAAKAHGKPGMSCRKAAVINVSTLGSSIERAKDHYDRFRLVPYRASKAALNMLNMCASLELQKDDVLCVLLHPGWVRTELGGPNAVLDAQESVQGMLKVMESLSEKNNGALLDYNGDTIPW